MACWKEFGRRFQSDRCFGFSIAICRALQRKTWGACAKGKSFRSDRLQLDMTSACAEELDLRRVYTKKKANQKISPCSHMFIMFTMSNQWTISAFSTSNFQIFPDLLLVACLLPVVRPGAPSSVLVPSSDAVCSQ